MPIIIDLDLDKGVVGGVKELNFLGVYWMLSWQLGFIIMAIAHSIAPHLLHGQRT